MTRTPGVGWAALGLRTGDHVTVLGERVAPHTDAWRAFFGDPPPGRSALDRKRAEAAAGPLLAPAIDWGKLSAAADNHRGHGLRRDDGEDDE